MVLAARDLNIDSLLWGGGAGAIKINEELKNKLDIPSNYEPILCASFGYATNKEESNEHKIKINYIK